MRRSRRGLFSWLADWTIRSTSDRPDREEMNRRMRHLSFETDVAKLGIRMTASLRDRLRRRWLKLKGR